MSTQTIGLQIRNQNGYKHGGKNIPLKQMNRMLSYQEEESGEESDSIETDPVESDCMEQKATVTSLNQYASRTKVTTPQKLITVRSGSSSSFPEEEDVAI